MENKHIEEIANKFNLDINEDIKLKLDSLSLIKLIMEIEKKFNIEIKNLNLNETESLSKIIFDKTRK